MGQSDSKVWVVLIQRSPRGPLTSEEVNALLDQKILRRNDVAFRMDSESDGKAAWKFIWQYPEFDRRSVTNVSTPPPQLAIPKPEQRERQEQRPEPNPLESIPEELLNIRPEELVGRATANPKPEFSVSEEEFHGGETRQGFFQSPTVVLGITFLVFAGFIGSFFFPGNSSVAPTSSAVVAKTQSPAGVRSPAEAPQPRGAMSLPSARIGILPDNKNPNKQRVSNIIMPKFMPKPATDEKQAPPNTVPVQRDAGEVSYEDYKHSRDKDGKDRDRDRDRDRDSEERENASEDEDESKKPAKKQIKRTQDEEDTEENEGVRDREDAETE